MRVGNSREFPEIPVPRNYQEISAATILLGSGFLGFLTARIEVFDLILLIDESYHHILLGFLVLLLIFYVIKITSWYFN